MLFRSLLTADRNLWNQVRDHISLRRMYVEDMRPKNLTGTSYVYFAAAKDILSGTRNIQLMEIADPALLSMKSYMILCTALAIRAYGVERASRIQFEAIWELYIRESPLDKSALLQETVPHGDTCSIQLLELTYYKNSSQKFLSFTGQPFFFFR